MIQFIYEIKCNGIKDDAARYILEHCIENNNNDDDDPLAIIKHEKVKYDAKKLAERQQEIEEEKKLQKNLVRRYGEKVHNNIILLSLSLCLSL